MVYAIDINEMLELVNQNVCAAKWCVMGYHLHISFTPYIKLFLTTAPRCIKPKSSTFQLTGLQILEYVKYFNRFQYLLILNLIVQHIQHIQIPKHMECNIWQYHLILRYVYWVIMKNEKVMKFLHCFEILALFWNYVLSKGLLLPIHHILHYYLVNDINGLLCVLLFQTSGDYYVQKYQLFGCFKWN